MKILRSIPGTRYQVSFCPSWRKMRTDEYRRKTIHHVYDADDDDDDDGDDGDDLSSALSSKRSDEKPPTATATTCMRCYVVHEVLVCILCTKYLSSPTAAAAAAEQRKSKRVPGMRFSIIRGSQPRFNAKKKNMKKRRL